MFEGWKISTVGETVNIASGQVDPKDEATANFISVGPDNLISGGGIDRSGLKTAKELGQISGKYAFDRRAILYSKIRPNLNKVALPDFDGICSADIYPMWISNQAHADRDFIFYVLTSERFVAAATSRSFRTGLPKINREDLESVEFALPPLPEQRKIAEILRTWDEALEKLTALRAAHEDRLVGLRDALIVRASRSGRPAYFGDFLTESRVPGTDGATARKISVRLYGKGATEKNEPRSGSANTRYYRRAAGQIIWSKLDFLNGAFALIGPDLDGCESTLDLPAFDCDPEVNPVWLIEYLTRPAYYTRQLHLARGQRKARRIAPDDWLASPLRLPDRATQDRVADTLACARAELALVEAEIEALTRQKRGLMQKLLTGEWRVAV